MLQNKLIADKTYAERIEEAMSLISLYSGEWTNFNPSDPGMTILEILTMFETLQQDHINEITGNVTEELLHMTGFDAGKGRPARLLLKASGVREDLEVLQGQPFLLGNIQYEATCRKTLHDNQLIAAYSVCGDQVKNISYILDGEANMGAKIFGDAPQEDNAVCFIANELPPAGEEMHFFASCEKDNRNPFEPKHRELFAEVSWECYTADGFKPIDVVDYCGGFLVSGEIRMKLKKDMVPAVYEELPEKGYCIRGRLTKCSYDKVPRVKRFDGFLMEVWQRTTRSYSRTVAGGNSITIDTNTLQNKYVTIFAREEKNGPYRIYREAPYGNAQGRFFWSEESGGRTTLHFDKEAFGFGPDKNRDCIRILVYDEDTMRRYKLGTLLGYDNQKIELPYQNLVRESFSVIAKRSGKDGDLYDFVKPGHSEDGALSYELSEQDGTLKILSAGKFIGAELLMGAAATNLGDKGNVREGNTFTAPGLPGNITFTNPYESTGGRYKEPLKHVAARFKRDIDIPFTATTADDYEQLVLHTPGLCIGKVRAIKDTSANRVKIAVLPATGEKRPSLSEDYITNIMNTVDAHRLLCTRVSIINPVYVPVNVTATVYAKPHFEYVKEKLEKRIEEILDFVNSGKQFGDPLKYDELFHAVESENYVSFVYDLRILPVKASQAQIIDQDIFPVENGLIVPGNIKLEVITQYGNNQ